jgi:hypothetical protein
VALVPSPLLEGPGEELPAGRAGPESLVSVAAGAAPLRDGPVDLSVCRFVFCGFFDFEAGFRAAAIVILS